MESIMARALEYTLKYWLKSFSRDQFKLNGHTAQLSNLDINGEAVHASMGLPAALNVTTARVGKLEITLPAVSYVQVEPIVVHIDKLDLVLEEKSESEIVKTYSSHSTSSSTTSAKGTGYGFADKISDGMTLEVETVNLLIETRGGSRNQGGANWSSPLASITIRNLSLYTTNENWQVVNLKEARDFSNNKKFIYVFKKLEWESLSVDLLPHPDMFTDTNLSSSNGPNKRDDDGAKRLFFGGERFLEGISGQANITVQRTELNSPLGLEIHLHIAEAVCPALSEPGLRALLRFMTGFYICLNREDADPKAQQQSTEAAGRFFISIIVDHIFLCIKDTEFQLELLMQSLFFSRVSVCSGENTEILSRVMVGGLFLRDTFSRPPCTLVQPSMFAVTKELVETPKFVGENFCPPIYPLGDEHWQFDVGIPLICMHSLQINPSPIPPTFASQTVVNCQPLKIVLQEESCLRISSFLADGIMVNPGDVLPDFSINSFQFTLKEFDLTIPLDADKIESYAEYNDDYFRALFSGARLHVEDLTFSQSPTIRCMLLNLDKDPACFSLWEDQPIDASQRKWSTRVEHLSISLETHDRLQEQKDSADWSSGLWRCAEINEACIEAAMVTADGRPLLVVPPPEGIVRIGVACKEYSSNTSVEQLFFVLDLYAYFGQVSERIAKVGKKKSPSSEPSAKMLIENIPSDTAVSLAVNKLHIKFLESSSRNIQEMPLVQFIGDSLFLKVSHRTLGGAFAVSTNLHWETVGINCVDSEGVLTHENGISLPSGNGYPPMKAVFWIENKGWGQEKTVPFLEITAVHVIPFNVQDMECQSLNISAKISGIRLGGGMNYTEALLHRFGILGPDGGPGEGLLKGLKNLSSGPLSKLFKASPLLEANHDKDHASEDEDDMKHLELGLPDDIDVAIELKNWLFALEGTQEMEPQWLTCNGVDVNREERCWHATFHSLLVKAKGGDAHNRKGRSSRAVKYPVELITVGIEGLQALKPRAKIDSFREDSTGSNQIDTDTKKLGSRDHIYGVNVEVCLFLSEEDDVDAKWAVENVKFSVKQPIEAVATKVELEHLALICKSEVDSMGRITAGILRLLKLEKSIGRATIRQLSNLGTESLDKIFTPEKLSRRESANSISFTPTHNSVVSGTPTLNTESIISSLESEISASQAKCSALISELSSSELLGPTEYAKQLHEKLENMQILLTRLRTL